MVKLMRGISAAAASVEFANGSEAAARMLVARPAFLTVSVSSGRYAWRGRRRD